MRRFGVKSYKQKLEEIEELEKKDLSFYKEKIEKAIDCTDKTKDITVLLDCKISNDNLNIINEWLKPYGWKCNLNIYKNLIVNPHKKSLFRKLLGDLL